MLHHLLAKLVEAGAVGHQLVDQVQPRGHVAVGQRADEAGHRFGVDRAQHLLHLRQGDSLRAVGQHLVEQADRVAHAALRRAGDGEQRVVFRTEALGGDDVAQMAGDLRCGNAAKIEALAAAEHSGRDLVRLGGGQDEAGVGRRLLQRLQQRVECAVAQHVHFIDDVDLVAAFAGAKAHLVAQFADVVDAVVRRRVDLDQVDHAPFGDRVAGGAGIAGAFAFRRGAVERLGQDARRTGLAGAAWPGEEIGVRNAVFAQRVAQGLGYMLLAHHLVKGLAAPFAIECGRHQHRPRSGRAPARRLPHTCFYPGSVPSKQVRGKETQ